MDPMNIFPLLTNDDIVELRRLPIGSVKEHIAANDPVLFDLRMSIAKKLTTGMMAHETTMIEWARDLYRTKYPLWQVYNDVRTSRPTRLAGGVIKRGMESFLNVLQVSEGGTLCINVVNTNDLVIVERWSPEQVAHIENTKDAPHIFFDPVGFILAMATAQQMK